MRRPLDIQALKNPSDPKPMSNDDVMWLASCTKLLTTVAALQCVERGQLKLDDNVINILPELSEIQILQRMEGGNPVLENSKKPITLRHLLIHTSGLAYEKFNPTIAEYLRSQRKSSPAKTTDFNLENWRYPLLFDPGESWEYGVGIDWAGWMIERVNSNISLEDYVEKNIWKKIGVTSFTFFPGKKPGILGRLIDMSSRPHDGSPNENVVHATNWRGLLEMKFCAGGSGGHCAPADFHKMLQSLRANYEVLLRRDTVEEMFAPHLPEFAKAALNEAVWQMGLNQWIGDLPPGMKLDWGLGGVLIKNSPNAKLGKMFWFGYANIYWFIDRETGICGVFAGQVDKLLDCKMLGFASQWKELLYDRMSNARL